MVSVETVIPRIQLAVPEHHGTNWKSPSLFLSGFLGIACCLSACIFAHEQSSWWLQLHAAWQHPLQRLSIITVCPSAGVELTCSDYVTVLTTTQFEARSWVTCCYMHGLSLTVPLKPDKTLSGEINSSGDRGKWLNSWPTREGFVQFKDSISWQKDLMSQWDTINTGWRKEAEMQKEKKKHRQMRECWKRQALRRWQRKTVSSLLKINNINSQIMTISQS